MAKGIFELSGRSGGGILVLCASLQIMPPPLDPDSLASILDLGAPTTPLSPHLHSTSSQPELTLLIPGPVPTLLPVMRL